MLQVSYYTMKFRLGQQKLNTADKIRSKRMHECPGNIFHNHPRKNIIFNRYQRRGPADSHKSYVMYWRSHPTEYAQMIFNRKNKV